MEVYFADPDLERLLSGEMPKARKYVLIYRHRKLRDGYINAVLAMQHVKDTNALRSMSYLHYEKLKHFREPMSSVRICNGSVERLLFREREDGIEVELIEINNTHYGNKR